jgi:hypothetical protein
VHRFSAILTILLFLQAAVNSFGGYCIPMSAECCPVVAANCDAGAAAPRTTCSSTCPLERIAKAIEVKAQRTSTCGHGCGSSEETECSSRNDVCGTSPCQSPRSEKYPTLSQACERPDNTRCFGQACVPQDCKPIRCVLLHPLLADSPPKAPSSVAPIAVELPKLPLLASSVPRAGPILPQVWGVSPIIQTTVLRI